MNIDFKIKFKFIIFVFLFFLIFFISFPQVDIYVSSLFYSNHNGFSSNEIHALQLLRKFLRWGFLFPAIACLVILSVEFKKTIILGIPRNIYAFVLLLYVMGPGLVVNSIFKNHWGRARPADIIAFGGKKSFTLPFEISDECQRNCSFVSGEGALSVGFFISIYVLSFAISNSTLRAAVLIFAGVFSLIGMVLRIMKGRHFLSDTIFSILLVVIVAFAISWFLNWIQYKHLSKK